MHSWKNKSLQIFIQKYTHVDKLVLYKNNSVHTDPEGAIREGKVYGDKFLLEGVGFKIGLEDIENKRMDTKGERGVGWDELGDWDWHIYTTDTMYKIDN